MYQLNYHSISKPGLNFEELDNILKKANAVNSEKNITGCLIYHNNRFVQILEGEKEDVLNVYNKIKSDKRHNTVTLLWENPVDKRYFPEWNMAYHQPNNSNIIEFVNNLLLLSDLSDRSTSTLLSFWATVRKILNDGKIKLYEQV
ncbi:BLUF domain-containing protein [Cyclobacterium amurskyense]|uniref:Bluf domain protein n=1 Tax=Cyclobacterium amurskyense TaxID=320787 RepID=A0A0H4P8M7_9BACT|nr:BLUF domain-containing protein [Cyclobacterium amurskyense]AKP50841.1 Bluf domain protein [Cyclobacterium amurskyense]|tara:strand:- start:18601 stop:19035 length:435 start_codon:yes stop_codon:yes gene_type:complete